ncbi:hypothetical protein NBO_27g0067 [Nosema bombycis CQ1]|uniref:Uncharacterized protein n=1 Tax=Nosema bombycis (strain CQ1 / CVCC 102059) TaxID=578461 RepID=R0MNS4_NOSB1|nr:hypothetical protein NBO_27g0067 [Nosema bombycis CQ1]|eukprot:EOB14513.1 hypothetical protein NBO_27g0067 [Nosema bombycis CQ1]
MPQMVNYSYFLLCGIVLAKKILQKQLINDSNEMKIKKENFVGVKGFFHRFFGIKTNKPENKHVCVIKTDGEVPVGEPKKNEDEIFLPKVKKKFKFKPFGKSTKDLSKNSNCKKCPDKPTINFGKNYDISNSNSSCIRTENHKNTLNYTFYDEKQHGNYKNNLTATNDMYTNSQKENVMSFKTSQSKISEITPLLIPSATPQPCQKSFYSFSKTNTIPKKEKSSRVSCLDTPITSNVDKEPFNRNIYENKNKDKTSSSAIASPSFVEKEKFAIFEEKKSEDVESEGKWKHDENVPVNESFDVKENYFTFQTLDSPEKFITSNNNNAFKNSALDENSNTFIFEEKPKFNIFNFNKLSIWTILFVATISFTISFFIMMIFK